MKRAAFSVHVSSVGQHPETQLGELREYVQRRQEARNLSGERLPIDEGSQ